MRIYLDTSVVNDAFVILQADGGGTIRKKDVKYPLKRWVTQYIALYYLLDLDDQWELEFGTANALKEEIERMAAISSIAEGKKSMMYDMYRLLIQNTHFVEPIPIPDYLYETVRRILPHKKGKDGDIKHICQALLGNWEFFLTTDFKSIINHTESLHSLGITVTSPLDFIENNFMTLEQLIRTLHGS
jgi:hypothetical protein